MTQQKLIHSPTLNTVIMVETTIKKSDKSILSVPELKRKLPKQINHNTLMFILEYLEESNKITTSLKGITWIHNPSLKLKKAINEGLKL